MPNLPTRNANPGDLKDPSTGNFRQFSDPKEGYAALLNDLHSKQMGTTTTGLGPSSTLVDFSKKYAPPSDNNNSAKYAADLANHMGVRPDAQLKDLDLGKWAEAVAHNEGYQGTPMGLSPENAQAAAGDTIGAPETLAQKALNFAFPIVKDIQQDMGGQNQKTALQQLGDLGLSALWFVPAVGPEAEAGLRGAGFLGKMLASKAGQGAALGYGADVASKLSQGDTGAGVLTPGMGTATGGLAGHFIPKLMGPLMRNLTQEGAVKSLEGNLGQELTRTAPTRNLMDTLPGGGKRAIKLLVHSGAMPEVEGNIFYTKDAITKLQKRLGALGEARGGALDKIAKPVKLDDLLKDAQSRTEVDTDMIPFDEPTMTDQQKKLRFALSGESGTMEKQMKAIIQNVKARLKRDVIRPSELEMFKEVQVADSGKYSDTGKIGHSNAASLLADSARKRLETMADESGFPGMREYNQYMKDHYDAIRLLKRLRNQVVKNGRLGNMMRQHAMGTMASVAGGFAGGGFWGTLLAGLGGEVGGNALGKIMGDASLSNPLKDSILKTISRENPAIVQKLLNFTKQKGGNAVQELAPKSSKIPGLAQNLITKGAIRGATQ